MGSGFIAIFKSYENSGLKTPIIIEGEGFVKCILPRESLAKVRLGDIELQSILSLFDLASEVSISEVVKNLSIPRTTAIRKLNALLKSGAIKKKGRGRSTVYFIQK